MRKIIALVCLVYCIVFGMVVCIAKEKSSDEYFVTEKEWSDEEARYSIVYAKDTGVKYCILKRRSSMGITPLYNTDGSLQISDKWNEVEE